MGPKKTINTFSEGMNKDIDKSLVSTKSYLDALNFRLITTEGGTSGSLENVKGNKQLSPLLDNSHTLTVGKTYYVYENNVVHDSTTYNPGDHFVATATLFTGYGYVIEKVREGQIIIGGIQLRDKVILFTTNNTSTTPSGGRSCIYEMEIDLSTKELVEDSLDLLYDDNLNEGLAASDFLNFSTAYPIKAIARYESERVQKVYWTDGYNYVRYANVAENLTVEGEEYELNNYMSIDKFNLTPNLNFHKPVASDVISGTLLPGIVQYTCQLYRLNGSETTFSPLSNTYHVTASNDLATNDRNYKGSEDPDSYTGKGFRIKITNTNNEGYDRARLVRIHYNNFNEAPDIDIVAEVNIEPDGSSFYINDVGGSMSSYALTDVNIMNTDLFKAQDIATKNNRLFAANIETDTFDVSDFDSRAIRFASFTETGDAGQTDTTNVLTAQADSAVTVTRVSDYILDVQVTTFPTWAGISGTRTVTDVLSVDVTNIDIQYVAGGSTYSTSLSDPPTTITTTVTSYAANTLIYKVISSGNLFPSGIPSSITICNFSAVEYEYEFTATGGATIEQALVQDEVLGDIVITEPADNTLLSSWATAGWDVTDLENDFPLTHNAINPFNDPDNRYLQSKEYQYQSDCSTLGAEGPNIVIGFTTDNFLLDNYSSVSADGYFSELEDSTVNPSFENYSSPWKSGERSFQRDEVYRLAVVYYDEKGRSSFPQWICDLKMPSIKETGYALTDNTSGDLEGVALYPTVTFRSLPTDAVAAQIYMVPRSASDRSVHTQGLACPFDTSLTREPTLTSNAITSSTTPIIKLVSPEMMFNGSIEVGSGDYVDYLGYYAATTSIPTASFLRKCTTFTAVTADVNNDSDIDDSIQVNLTDDSLVYDVDGIDVVNYNGATTSATTDGMYGCSGLIMGLNNTSWDAIGATMVLINYNKNVFESQYGGNTSEDRSSNYYRPCSDILTETDSSYTIKNGDTFINYFGVATFLYDLDKETAHSTHETVYIPVESSINCDLRHDLLPRDYYASDKNWWLMQETAGTWEDGSSREFIQEKDLYQYNTVYSQEQTIGYKYAKPFDWVESTTFDTMIKNSQVKINGEISDSWTDFRTNDFIEVDSTFGTVNAIKTFNNNLYYFQDRGVGIVSVNPRSLIQDSTGSDLVLGTGGVLDRYDYISTEVGTVDKFSVITSKAGLYWFDQYTKSINTTNGSNFANLSKAKFIHSYLENNVTSDYTTIAAHDTLNDEVLFTFTKSSTSDSFTLAYNEIAGVFTSFYSFIPTLYIPYKSELLSTTSSTYSGVTDSNEFLWLHNSDDVDRCQFYALYTDDTGSHYDSTIKVLFNSDYAYTKVFDSLAINTNLYSSGTTEVYNKTFDEIRCYDDYQNTDTWTLTYDGTYSGTTQVLPYQRRERTYNTFVPRNAVDTNITSNPDIFNAANLDTTGIYKDRMRDKYLITDLTFENDGTYGKLVFSNIGLTYRISYR